MNVIERVKEMNVIERWKNNEKAYKYVDAEMKAFAERVGRGQFEWMDAEGDYLRLVVGDSSLYDGIIYRLLADYQEPDEYVECEVKPNAGCFCGKDSLPGEYLSNALNNPNFIGFNSDGWLWGRLYKNKGGGAVNTCIRLGNLDQYEVLPIDSVVFKKAGEK